MIYAAPGAAFEATVIGFATGLVGTIGVRLLDNVGGTTTARTTAGIIETPAGSGKYAITLSAPAAGGQYSIFWDDGIVAPGHVGDEDLVVTSSLVSLVAGADPLDMTTVSEVKSMLETSTAGIDTLIQTLVTAASGAINNRYDRELTPKTAAATRRFAVRSVVVDLAPYELRSATSVTLDPGLSSQKTLVANVDYELLPITASRLTGTRLLLKLGQSASLGLETAYRYEFGHNLLDVAGSWGAWNTTDVPADIRRACAMTVMSWLDRAVKDYAVAAAADPRQLRPAPYATWAIPSDAHSLLVGAGVPRMTG